MLFLPDIPTEINDKGPIRLYAYMHDFNDLYQITEEGLYIDVFSNQITAVYNPFLLSWIPIKNMDIHVLCLN